MDLLLVKMTVRTVPILSSVLSFLLQDVDFVMTGLTITGQREAVIDYSYPFWEEPLAMVTLLKAPDPARIFKVRRTLKKILRPEPKGWKFFRLHFQMHFH